MDELKQLIEDFVEYTRTWSISETEWYWNIDAVRKSDYINEKHITEQEFETAIRQDILYCFIYNIGSIARQLENDLCNYELDNIHFQKASKEIEQKIQKIFKDFKIERFEV